MPAILVASVVVGAAAKAKASRQAANAQSAAADSAISEQQRQYDQTRADQQPYMQSGTNALAKLQDPNANFQASPDYAFRRSEGQRDIGNSFAARGGAFSGNALKALTDYNSNIASNEYGNWWSRQAGLAGQGQTATQAVDAAGANKANAVGNALMYQGNARASGIQGQGDAISGMATDLGGIGYNWNSLAQSRKSGINTQQQPWWAPQNPYRGPWRN